MPTWIGTLVFYESFNPPVCDGGVCLDWIYMELANSVDGPWDLYFYWGDTVDTNNGLILPSHFPPEDDNETIPPSELYPPYYGILIPIGSTYRYVRFTAPDPCFDEAQVDAIDIIP
jgi:hypothetical protein